MEHTVTFWANHFLKTIAAIWLMGVGAIVTAATWFMIAYKIKSMFPRLP